ncbi:alpha/beta hydrolase [Galbitalea sp. SE-J8]|uniref:alpha/beta fold hydrolase n=1 Tax=Galbitalea sp. SE-J8 TaxID=3054952 RepID=UPI00259D2DE8|nr:alpha/beta hydrolase [Galbitalea sp. SE-J8]MDM4762171.1 alpha/beta hydrolase [Galbitalea sp. SE-J8]
MSRVVLVGGLGGVADLGFLALALGRFHEVVLADPRDRLAELTDADTILVGYSLGATVAAVHAAGHDVAALVLVSGWLDPTPGLVHWTEHAADPDFAARTLLSPAGWAAARESAPAARRSAPHHGNAASAVHRGNPNPGRPHHGNAREPALDPKLVALAARTGVGDAALGIRAPALVVGASLDTVAPLEQTRLLAAAVPDARYTELPTGHAALSERPAQVHAVVDAFLRAPQRHPAGAEVAAWRP